jgi:hypothetical protein
MTIDVIATARRRTRAAVVKAGLVTTAIVAAGTALVGYANGSGSAASLPTSSASEGLAPEGQTSAGLASAGLASAGLASAGLASAGLASAGPDSAGPAPVVELPADTVWTVVDGVALPVSASAGPRTTSGGLASGFAHTPAGALIAAAHLLVRTTPQVGSAVFGPTLRRQVVGRYAAAMNAVVTADYRALGGDAAGGGPVGSLTSTLAGARLAAYAPSVATVELLTVADDSTGTARFAATPVTMVWTGGNPTGGGSAGGTSDGGTSAGGDWALDAPPQGRWDSLVTPVPADQITQYPPVRALGERLGADPAGIPSIESAR